LSQKITILAIAETRSLAHVPRTLDRAPLRQGAWALAGALRQVKPMDNFPTKEDQQTKYVWEDNAAGFTVIL